MTVDELIKRLELLPRTATVVMCMDGMGNNNEQWEDNLGDITYVDKDKAKWIYLINESFE